MKKLKHFLRTLLHPVKYYRICRSFEKLVLFQTACNFCKISSPSIWDIDKLAAAIADILMLMHESPDILDDFPRLKKSMFWTRLLSHFKQLEVTKDEVKRDFDAYNRLLATLKHNKKLKEKSISGDLVIQLAYHSVQAF